MITKLSQIIDIVRNAKPKTIVVAQAVDDDCLKSCDECRQLGLANYILLGKPDEMKELAAKLGFDWVKDDIIVPTKDDAEAAREAVRYVREGKADTLMKGHLHTGTFLKALVDKETGLRGSGLISHCGVYENPINNRLLIITDIALNVAPDLMQKKQIIENTVGLARKLGIETPKVAILTALETVNPDMPETMEAAILAKMGDRGQIKNCLVDGPFAMDNALSKEAAKNKGLTGPVAGDADIILCPDIKTGNAVHKVISYLTPIKHAATTLGARVPLVMTSRTDPVDTKVASTALGLMLS